MGDPSCTDIQFEIQLREYGAIVAAQKAFGGFSGMSEHKRPWDGDG